MQAVKVSTHSLACHTRYASCQPSQGFLGLQTHCKLIKVCLGTPIWFANLNHALYMSLHPAGGT
jgi:hypothetical protein